MPKLGGPQAHSRFEAELERVTHVLESYGVLTEHIEGPLPCGPVEPCGLHPGPRRGVGDGRLKKLGSKFYELAEPPAR